MKRAHDESDVYGASRRPGPPGLQGTHPTPGLPVHSAGFPPHVLAPAPSQLAHSFEQMRDNLPRPPFSTPHLPVAAPSNPAPVAPPPHLPPPPPPPSSAHPPKPTYQTHIQTPNPAHATAAGQQQYQRLKVEDALSYLDQVKLQFGNQPQVYNEFLDIMKEFKSQSIDTPGVISRVSALFKGHPDLIVGFNTFLPPGYKIEVSLTDINTVNVCAPTGTTTHLISGNGLIAAPTQPSKNVPPSSTALGTSPGTSSIPPTLPSTTAPVTSAPKSPTRTTADPVTKPSSPSVKSSALPLSLPSPSVQSQTQAQHHAINYVTKIKNRFQGQPEVYQKFLDILNNYQTEQKAIKENAVDQYGRPLQEQDVYVREGKLASEVYAQVAKLFNKQEDLLQEFSQFLPDATGSSFNPTAVSLSTVVSSYQPLSKKANLPTGPSGKSSGGKSKKNAPSSLSLPTKTETADADSKENGDKHMKKRHKSALKDVSLAEAVKHGNLSEFAFFEKVRKALKSPEVYENFLRCLVLFNQEVISRPELIQLATTFLGKFPDLFTWFKMFLGYKDHHQTETNISGFKDRGTGGELAHLEIDFASCKRSGASYRALPKSYTQPKCSGRTALCKEVLNDTWVSLPSWSEDTQFPGTRKTQYEEYIYKCEDERFELDVVIEMNLSTIKVLEGVQKKLSRMSSDEQQKYRLDNSLGGTSEINHRKSIYRIYGDKASEVIDGLKKTPHVAISLVLKRLKQKDEEWRTAQKQFNKIWREQNEKYYLKSLDHQGINFKQNDLKIIRSKSLIREIEQMFEEKNDQIEDVNADVASGPHLTFKYQDQSTLEDASALIIHHMKRQTSIHKDDKAKIKSILLHFLQNLFFAPQGDLSDDEQDTDVPMEKDIKQESLKNEQGNTDDLYNLIFVNNTWYSVLRMHQILCERLLKMYHLAMRIAKFEARDKKYRREGTAEALRLKKPGMADVEEYYPVFLDMVKNLLDGQLDPNGYEDTLRESFGVNSYVSFTMDKLIQNIVRQLHNLVTDDGSLKIIEMYNEEKCNNATGGSGVSATMRAPAEMLYQKRVENLLVDENCFKVILYKDQGVCKISVELLPSEDDQSEDQVEAEKWAEYVEKYVGNTDISPELKDHLCKKPIFLLRTARILQKRLRVQEPDKTTDFEMKDEQDGGENEDTDDATAPVEESKEKLFPDVVMENKLECKISMNSYKMRYVSGTSDIMFRKGAFKRTSALHPKINVKLHDAYTPQHSAWLHENTTREQCRVAEDWMVGKHEDEDMLPCVTTKDTVKHGGIAVNRYSVVYSKEVKQEHVSSPVTLPVQAKPVEAK